MLFDRFLVERVAGHGGMGTVYRARDQHDGRMVALKVLAAEGGAAAERFEREARLLAELAHPGIVGYVAHGRGAHGRFLAMEWLEGEDLERALSRGPLTLSQTLALGAALADALAFAHARGVVHRDVKPSNLYLVDGDVADVRILDFGVARWHASSITATRAGSVLGTLSYMAPEQARGEPDIDARADVFSLACVLFECVTGQPAFVGDHPVAVLAKILFEQAPRASEVCEGVPAELDALLARMLEKEPQRRPADAREVAGALRALAGVSPAMALPRVLRPPALTGGERRLVSVILMGPMSRGSSRGGAATPESARGSARPRALATEEPLTTAATLELASVDEVLDAIRAVTQPWSAAPELLLDGSVVVLLQGDRRAGPRAPDAGQLEGPLSGRFEVGPLSSPLPSQRSGPAAEAAHAAACALALRAAVPGVPLALATGWAEVTGRFPLGEAIDRAAALLDAAAASAEARAAIRIDESTAALLDASFETRASPSGVDLVGRRDDDGVRTLLGKPTPCLGRDVELATLRALLDQCANEPIARAVVVVGPAGVGKSRLRHEVLRHARTLAEPPEIWVARGDSMRPCAAYDLLAQALRRAAGILESDPAQLRRTKLTARVRRHMHGEAAVRAAEFLGEIVGAAWGDENSVQLRAARRDPLVMGDQIRRAACDLLAAQCAAAPLVLVLEDLQWGDLPTVNLVDTALRLLPDAPLFVLATARPEVSELFPSLWAERDARTITLSGLTRKTSEKLVRAALGDRASPDLVARLVEQAGGNAFFLEELIRAASEGKDGHLPQTVLAMIEARLETLEPEARRVLRAASVFGEVVWEEGIGALLGAPAGRADARRWAEELSRREVFVRRGEGRFANQTEYAFRNSLVRETAYAMLTGADRTLGHRLAAEWLERAGEQDATALAEHYARGGSKARAAELFARAAEQALEGNDFRTAIARAERGREHGAAGEALGALLLVEANAHLWLGDDVARSFAAARDAMDLLSEGSVPWCIAAATAANMAARLGREPDLLAVAVRIARLLEDDIAAPVSASAARSTRVAAAAVTGTRLFVAGRNDAAEELLTAAESAAVRIDPIEPAAWARLVAVRAWQALVRGDPSEFLVLAADAVALFDESGDRRSACNQRMNVGYAYNEVGAYADAERALRETLRVAEELGISTVQRSARHNLGWAIGRMGRLEEGFAMQLAVAKAFQAGGDRRMEGASRMYAAALLGEAGEAERAIEEARSAIELLAAAPPLRAAALGVLARIHLRRGAVAEALDTAREAKRALDDLGHIEEGDSLIRLVLAESLETAGRHAEARQAIHEAGERVLMRAEKIAQARYRDSFLRDVPENARTLELFEAWRQVPRDTWPAPC